MLILSPEMIELYHILKEQRALNNKEKTQIKVAVRAPCSKCRGFSPPPSGKRTEHEARGADRAR